ncbi:helix-turn-helix domain-containing protein [Litorilinea aerophila]|uniref:Helix-turn-helix domain-containing protein n=1 Tax=Litorilinea aerophila TaxID=1204385 RepID=A0A540V914_9CHLR|nr:helix-turn-helix domain-containing protein [Litorilinea aerophila]MCC9078865.1 helix-turn-helix domain-containing protein [Litorilinea aerophila]GIV78739.1 MAG: DNA-binding protein [Litorilinea sp.]
MPRRKSQRKRELPAPAVDRSTPPQWLTLKQASDFLGIHYTTLRSWADKGEIPVFRTPGGHRRFSLADLRRFLDARLSQRAPGESEHLVSAAIVRVREEIQKISQEQVGWHYPLEGDAVQQRRQRGRRLFALAISYVLKPKPRPRLLQEGRRLGFEYGREAALSGVGLTETGRAVQFFRHQLYQVIRSGNPGQAMDADDVRIQQLIDQFLDEVLYAVLDGYEQQLRGDRAGPGVSQQAPDEPFP